MSNKEIADTLVVAEATVKSHMRSIREKLNANGRTHAVTIALHRGWISNPVSPHILPVQPAVLS